MTIVVGMSGGVDSSVSAALLKEAGYRVVGLFMQNWEEADGSCSAAQDFEDVVRTCRHLGVPYYSVSLAQEYRERVFAPFLRDLEAGLTPNPDVLCNREIKFDAFLRKGLELGDAIATGHYCQHDGARLLRGADPDKDQSYFLYAIDRNALQKVLFPVGHLRKAQVRELARQMGLPTAEKKDSTGICFIGKRNFKAFVSQYLGYRPGPLCRLDGTVVGTHDGSAYYTLGQRQGLGLGGEGEAWYVVGKEGNTVFVERGAHHPALFASELIATQWTCAPSACTAKIRYRQRDVSCVCEGDHVRFEAPQRAITPGQSIVFYEDAVCLGGAVIAAPPR